MSQTILITAAKEDSEKVLSQLADEHIIHAPLEIYTERTGDAEIVEVLNELNTFDNIVYSSKRNAIFFLQQVESHDKMDAVKNSLNLAFDESTFTFLEDEGIPAVHPQNGSKAIDLVELMLRLQRLGATLYPCGTHKREDFPGLLEELDMPVTELDVFDLEGPTEEALAAYQEDVKTKQPDTIIFHSRRSVNRTLAAFPDLEYENMRIISADSGITNKLQEKGLSVDVEADGSWETIAELV